MSEYYVYYPLTKLTQEGSHVNWEWAPRVFVYTPRPGSGIIARVTGPKLALVAWANYGHTVYGDIVVLCWDGTHPVDWRQYARQLFAQVTSALGSGVAWVDGSNIFLAVLRHQARIALRFIDEYLDVLRNGNDDKVATTERGRNMAAILSASMVWVRSRNAFGDPLELQFEMIEATRARDLIIPAQISDAELGCGTVEGGLREPAKS